MVEENGNGHSETFEMEETEELRPRPKVGAGQGAFAVAEDQEFGGWNAAEQMFLGSADPTVYLTHTRITEKSIARTTRLNIWLHRFTLGYIDINKALVWKFNAEIGRDGKARTEVRQIATSQQYIADQQKIGAGYPIGRDMQKNPVSERP